MLNTRLRYFRGDVATQFCGFNRKRKDDEWMALHREQDSEAIRSLCFATRFFFGEQHRFMDPQWHAFQLAVFVPVLVIGGPIYVAREKAGDLEIELSERVRLHQTVIHGGDEHRFQVEVVSEDALGDLLDDVRADLEVTAGLIKPEMNTIWREADDLRQKLGPPGGTAA